MTLLALIAIILFGFATYNLSTAFADIPTSRTLDTRPRAYNGSAQVQKSKEQTAERGRNPHGRELKPKT